MILIKTFKTGISTINTRCELGRFSRGRSHIIAIYTIKPQGHGLTLRDSLTKIRKLMISVCPGLGARNSLKSCTRLHNFGEFSQIVKQGGVTRIYAVDRSATVAVNVLTKFFLSWNWIHHTIVSYIPLTLD